MSRSALFAVALLLATAPVYAVDYVQAPGSSLAFAGSYQGEVFTRPLPRIRHAPGLRSGATWSVETRCHDSDRQRDDGQRRL
jgi:hypothetical protein